MSSEVVPWWKKRKGHYTSSSSYKSSLGFDEDYLEKKFYGGSWAIPTSYYSSSVLASSSSISIDEEKEKELFYRSIINSARDLIVVLDLPFNVVLEFSYEIIRDGALPVGTRRLHLPTEVLDDDTKTKEEKTSIVCGYGIHEAAHLLYTEYEVYKKFLGIINGKPLKVRNALNSLFSIIEDNRVENLLLKSRPGYSGFIEFSRKRTFELYCNPGSFRRKMIGLFDLVFRYIRFPFSLEEDVITKNQSFFERLDKAMDSVNLESTKDSYILALKVFDCIFNYCSDNSLSINSQGLSVFDYESSGSTDQGGKVVGANELLYGSDEDSTYSPRQSDSAKDLEGNEIFNKLISGKVERGGKNTYFYHASGDKGDYLEISKEVSKYVPRLKKIIKGVDKNFEFNIFGCRQGLLDTNKLAEAYQGVPQVYVRKGKVTTNKTTLVVLLDESGSMAGDKETLARQAAVLLNDAFGSLPGVDLYIYGHTADTIREGSVEINIYREGNKEFKYSLSSSEARYQNRDGTAIREVAERVKSKISEDQNPIMIVISDGNPAALGYYGPSAVRDVRSSVTAVERQGFTVIQVSIDYVSAVKGMFTNYVDLRKDINNLPKVLNEMIKKIIVNDKKSRIEL